MHAAEGGYSDVVIALLESHANTEFQNNVRVVACAWP